MMNLVDRVNRTQKTIDVFKGKQFVDWKVDCIQLIGTHARHMGKRVKLPKYNDAKSAADAMRSLGFKTLSEAMDANFTRIDPGKVLVSDIVETLGTNGFSALMVALGNGRTLGFHETIPHCDVLQPLIISGAWRIGD